MDEPKHPTYGTLGELLQTIRDDVIRGYVVRVGLLGALEWFSRQYGEQRSVNDTEVNRD